MSNKITGKEYPLSKVFGADFEYHIPGYQRPYAWTEEETGILFDDLYEFFKRIEHRKLSALPLRYASCKMHRMYDIMTPTNRNL